MSSRRSRFLAALWTIALAAVAVLASHPAFSQTFRGGIHGTVEDPSGALLAGAEVKAESDETGQGYSTVTTSAGEFTFQDLPLGTYSVSINAAGFEGRKILQVTVRAASIYHLPVKLAMASVATKLEVAAAALSVDTTTSVQTDDLATSTVQTIPMNGRDFTQLLTVTPGYAGYGVGFMSAINGSQATQINWQIEGADNNDAWINTSAVNQGGVYGIPGILLPLDSVDEFSLVTQGGAETGRNPGGTVNLVLKSGTNKLHGSAYYYNRNEALAASPVFAANGSDTPQKNKLRDQQYGFTFGGPVFRDKTFFFLSFEHQSFDIGNPTLVTEPSQAYQQAALAVLTQYNVPVNPVSENLLAGLWPASALTGLAQPDNYFNPGTEDGYSNNGILKLDHAFNESNHVSLRAFVAQGHQIAPTSSFLSPYFESSPMHVENWALVYNTTFSPRLANQFVFGLNYFEQTFADADTNFNPIALGLNTGVTNPQLAGAPNMTIGAFDPIGPNPYSGRQDTTWHLNDALNYNVGKHQLRFGGEFRRATRHFQFYRLPRALGRGPKYYGWEHHGVGGFSGRFCLSVEYRDRRSGSDGLYQWILILWAGQFSGNTPPEHQPWPALRLYGTDPRRRQGSVDLYPECAWRPGRGRRRYPVTVSERLEEFRPTRWVRLPTVQRWRHSGARRLRNCLRHGERFAISGQQLHLQRRSCRCPRQSGWCECRSNSHLEWFHLAHGRLADPVGDQHLQPFFREPEFQDAVSLQLQPQYTEERGQSGNCTDWLRWKPGPAPVVIE
jgi:hypothetical protein